VKKWPFILAYVVSLSLGPIFLSITLIGFLVALRGYWFPMVKKASYKKLFTWGLTGTILSLLVQYVWFQVNTKLFNYVPESINTNQLLNTIKSSPGMIIVICLVCPILEEIVFRKMIFDTFQRNIGIFSAAIVTSFIFSLIHFDFVNTLVYMFIGLVFSWIHLKAKNIAAPIISHIAMNTIVLIIMV
jgi:uncharacterized protein